MNTVRKKLIEVALPLEAINTASAREKSIRHGHPSTLHLWWARRPLAAARAVLFAQMVDDPSARLELFPTDEAQSQERQRLFRIIEDLVKWENTTNETVLEAAREDIRKSWRRTCEENQDHPRATELFDPDELPAFHDPFAGGGSIPLEAQRLGLEAHASDLNPVAVLINKAMIEIPPKFVGKPPVNPEARKGKGSTDVVWRGTTGLAEDVCYYGKWIRDEAEKRIGRLYPKIEVTAEMARERPDLKSYVGRKLTVIAWLWARTVKSPNPAFANVDVPLASTFVLSTKNGKEAYVKPVIEDRGYRFTIRAGKPPAAAGQGTKLARGANFQCLMSGAPMTAGYIRRESQNGGIGARLMAIVTEGDRSRIYIEPTPQHEAIPTTAKPAWKPDLVVPTPCHDVDRLPMYGMPTWGDAFTSRQLVALTTFSDLVGEVQKRVLSDAVAAGMPDDGIPLRNGGTGAVGYAEAVGVYLGLATGRTANSCSSFSRWQNSGDFVAGVFSRQAIPMLWDYAETNVFSTSTQNWMAQVNWVVEAIATLPAQLHQSHAFQDDAASPSNRRHGLFISTDPPYYDNVGYADLSDFFYVWLRRSLQQVFPDLFATLATPKADELVATPYRHGNREKAEAFFLDGMTQVMGSLADQTHPTLPVTIYYAFKQSETKGNLGTASTGWETFLDAIIKAQFGISGTWPVRTERNGRVISIGTNALASSIVLVCRPRPVDAPVATRREFIDVLKSELPDALRRMQQGNIAPVDLAQAAIGPGMAVFTRFARVLDASGQEVTVREALALINQTLDEVLAEQEGDFDADTQWALAWFEQSGFDDGDYGVAETLSTAKNISVAGMVEAGVLRSGAGKVRLLRPHELPEDWVPGSDTRLIVWEAVHHLVRVHDKEGEDAAASLMSKLGPNAEAARELAYRLYRICDQKNRSQEALGYNGLVQSWPEVARLAQQVVRPMQGRMGLPDDR